MQLTIERAYGLVTSHGVFARDCCEQLLNNRLQMRARPSVRYLPYFNGAMSIILAGESTALNDSSNPQGHSMDGNGT
jgi:hypothetical protein